VRWGQHKGWERGSTTEEGGRDSTTGEGQYRGRSSNKGEGATVQQLPSVIPLSVSLRVIWMYFRAKITTTRTAHAMSRVPKITPYSSPRSVVLSPTSVVVVVGGLALGTVTLTEPCRRKHHYPVRWILEYHFSGITCIRRKDAITVWAGVVLMGSQGRG